MEDVRSAAERRMGAVWRVCEVCHREFIGNAVQKYCSRECREIGDKRRIEALKAKRGGEKEEERVCPVCGKAFKCSAGKVKIYCSRRCKDRKTGRKTEDAGAEETIWEWLKEKTGGTDGKRDFRGDRIAAINEYARRQGKSYGEIQAERLIEKMKRKDSSDVK